MDTFLGMGACGFWKLSKVVQANQDIGLGIANILYNRKFAVGSQY